MKGAGLAIWLSLNNGGGAGSKCLFINKILIGGEVKKLVGIAWVRLCLVRSVLSVQTKAPQCHCRAFITVIPELGVESPNTLTTLNEGRLVFLYLRLFH